jgi:hypothetical protein
MCSRKCDTPVDVGRLVVAASGLDEQPAANEWSRG